MMNDQMAKHVYIHHSCIAVLSQAGKKLPQDMMTQLDGECVRILAAYRKHCASSASPGQLILPESFKVLPLYMLGLKKSAAMRRGM